MTTPTGVFVRLPLSEDQAHVFLKESSHAWDEFNGASDAIACEAGLIAIGTRVTGSDVKAVCSIDEDILRNIRDLDKDDEEYVTDMVFRPGYDGTVDLVRQSDHLAALASLQAEVGRLREALEEQKTYHESEDKALSKQPTSGQGLWRRNQHQEQIRLIDATLKGPEA